MAAVPTTQSGVAPVSTAANPMTNAMEDHFQNLFDTGRINEATMTNEEPRAPKANPAELAEAAKPEPTEVEALGAAEAEPEAEAPLEYEDLDAFLADNKLDAEAFQGIPVKVKIDGKEQRVPLADVIKSFQLEGHVNNKSIELSNAQKQFEQEREAAVSLYRQQLTNAKTLGELAQATLMGEFQQINWNELQRTDPVQWTVQQQMFNNKAAAINQHLQQVAAAQQAQEQARLQAQAALLPQERQKLLEKVPEWKDAAKYEAALPELEKVGRLYGFNQTEILSLASFDHRVMHALHDLMTYRANLKNVDPTLKRVRAAPKMASPGTRTSRDPKAVAKQQAMERFTKNPHDVDAQSAFFETLL